MKKINSILLFFTAVILLASCAKEEYDPHMYLLASPAITAPSVAKTYELKQEDAANVAETFTWTAADFGYPAAITYTLQFAQAGKNFTPMINVASSGALTYALNVKDLNQLLLAQSFKPGIQYSMEGRVKASVGDYATVIYSPVYTFKVTPYEEVINYPKIYVPGNFQGASGYTSDWSPDKAPNLYSVKSDEKYEGYVYLGVAAPEFKFTKLPDWTLNWGDSGKDGSLDAGGDNITAETGYYKMNVNLNNFTYTVTKTEWGLIGDGTPGGWDTDTNMTYNKDTKVWTVTLNLTAASIKFRANDAWALNYGDNGADLTLEPDGANITVPSAGNYTVTLNLSKAIYSYTLKKN